MPASIHRQGCVLKLRAGSAQSVIANLRTDEDWLYLAVVIDWLVDVITNDGCDALQMVLWRRKRPENVIVHAERGGQYCSADYQALLKRHNLRSSMSAKGSCYDNACVESFSTH